MRGAATPPTASRRLLIPALAALVIVIGALGIYFVLKKSGRKEITAGASVDLTTQTIPPSGGTIAINKPGDPLDGLKIDVPAGAYSDARAFHLSYAPVTKHNLGSYFNPISPLITIENGGGAASSPMEMRIPVKVPDGHFAMAFLYDDATGKVEGMPLVESESDHVTALTLSFDHSTYAGIGKRASTQTNSSSGGLFAQAYAADAKRSRGAKVVVGSVLISALTGDAFSKFKPGADDWQFPNYGSYIETGGHCAGQSIAAIWYYSAKRLNDEPPLYGRYDNDGVTKTPDVWQDDVGPYKFCSIVQHDAQWDSSSASIETRLQGSGGSGRRTFYALSEAIAVTGEPQLLAIYGTNPVDKSTVGHAIIAYKIDRSTVYVADPNYPANEERTIKYSGGELQTYNSGLTATSPGIPFNHIYYLGQSAFFDWSKIADRWQEVENGTIGKDHFPPFTLQAKNAKGDFVTLDDDFSSESKTLSVRVTAPPGGGWRGLRINKVFNEQGTELTFWGGTLDLKPGKQRLGFYITDDGGHYVGFKWVTVKVGDETSPPEVAGDGPLGGHLTATLTVDGVDKPFNDVHFSIEKDKDKDKGSLLSMTFEDAAFVDRSEANQWMFQMAIWGFHGDGTYQITNASSLWCRWTEGEKTFSGVKQGTLTIKEWRGVDKFSGEFDLVLEIPLVGVSDREKRSIKGSFSFKKEN